MVCIFLSAAALAAHEDESFTLLIIFKRQAFCMLDDCRFNRYLDSIDHCYMVIFFRLLQSQTNLRASSAIAAKVDTDAISTALCQDLF
jgi:hypothetical protein